MVGNRFLLNYIHGFLVYFFQSYFWFSFLAAPATPLTLKKNKAQTNSKIPLSKSKIRPLAEHQVPCLPRKSHRQSGGDQGTPGRTSDPLQSTKCRACHAKATGDQGTPGRTSDALQSTKCRACHAKPSGRAAETKGRQGVHPTPCRAPSAAPATQKPPETKGRQGVHPTPCRAPSAAPATQSPRKCCACHAKATGDQGTPGCKSDPLQSTKCRACHLQSTKYRACHAKATGRAAETKGRQSVHPTPCRAPSAAPATQKPPAEQRRPRDTRAYIRPLAEHQVPRLPRVAEHQVPRLPRKSYRQSGGDQGTPGRTSDPLQSIKCRACHAKATGDRQGVHPTPCRAPSAAPATQKPPAERRRPRDARAYIRPLAEHQVPCLPRKSHRQSGGDQGTPGRTSDPLQSTKCRACRPSAAPATQKPPETKERQGVHPTPCRAPSAAPATQSPAAERRRPRDARAYIRPLAEHQVPRLPRKSHRRPRDARAYIQPLAEHQVPRLPRKVPGSVAPATQKPPETKGRQGVNPTPCRAPSAAPATCRAPSTAPATQKPPAERRRPRDAAPATQKPPETKGRQSVHPTPCRAPSAAPATQKPPAEQRRPRDTRAYIRPLAEHQVPRLPRVAEHQVPRLPRKSHRQSGGDQGTPGRTSDPLQSIKCRACHAKATGDRQGVHPTPCRAPSAAPATQKPPAERRRPRDARAYIRPLAEHQVPRLPRKSHRRPRDGAYIRPLAEHQVPRLPRKSHRQSSGDQGTPGRTSDPLQSTKCRACHAKATGDQGTPGRTSDPLQSTKCRACHAKATGRAAETKERQGVSEWASEWVSDECVSMSEWWVCASEWVCVNEWVNEWVHEWVSEWASEWVSEGGGREGGGADTELKTKTPHVNVGNTYTICICIFDILFLVSVSEDSEKRPSLGHPWPSHPWSLCVAAPTAALCRRGGALPAPPETVRDMALEACHRESPLEFPGSLAPGFFR